MKGRFWQLNKKGHILNDSSEMAISEIFKPLIDDVLEATFSAESE